MKSIEEKINCFKNKVNPLSATMLAATGILYDIFQDPRCDEQLKNNCMDQLVNTIVWRIRNKCVFELLCEFSTPFRSKHCPDSFIRNVLNDPRVADSICKASTSIRYHYLIHMVVECIETFFSAESIRKILSRRNKDLITFIFGHHHALLQDVELQKKWIKSYLSYKKVEPVFGIRYITKEAIESLPLEISHAFIRKIINYLNPKLMLHFDIDVVKRIAVMYTIVHGKNKDSDYILYCVMEYQNIFNSH